MKGNNPRHGPKTILDLRSKVRFSEIIGKVKDRRRIIITERGRPIAEVIPYQQEQEQSFDAHVERLQSLGVLVPAERSTRKMHRLPIQPIRGATKEFLEIDRD
jgi:prevent-host-death family protein